MTDKESPNVDTLVDYEPSDGEDDRNEPPPAEPEKDPKARQVRSASSLEETDEERKERARRSAEKISAITGDPVLRRNPSPMGRERPRRQSSDGSTPAKRIDASSVVVDKIGPKANEPNPTKRDTEAYRSALQGCGSAPAGSKEPEVLGLDTGGEP